MSSIAELSTEGLRRLPGLYRRWELLEVFEPRRKCQIEDAGVHTDGTPLLAIYVSDSDSGAPVAIERPPRPAADLHARHLRRFGERVSRSFS